MYDYLIVSFIVTVNLFRDSDYVQFRELISFI